MSPADTAEARRLASEGLGVRAIARELGCSKSAVSSALRQAEPPPAPAEPAVPATDLESEIWGSAAPATKPRRARPAAAPESAPPEPPEPDDLERIRQAQRHERGYTINGQRPSSGGWGDSSTSMGPGGFGRR